MKFNKFSKQNKSIDIINFIDDNLGSVKLYKSKKRLELRFKKTILTDKLNYIKLY